MSPVVLVRELCLSIGLFGVCKCKYCIWAVLSPESQDMCVGVISVCVFPSVWTLIKSRACSQCRLCESRKSHTTAISHPRTSSNLIALLAQRSLNGCDCEWVCVCVLKVRGNFIYVLVCLCGCLCEVFPPFFLCLDDMLLRRSWQMEARREDMWHRSRDRLHLKHCAVWTLCFSSELDWVSVWMWSLLANMFERKRSPLTFMWSVLPACSFWLGEESESWLPLRRKPAPRGQKSLTEESEREGG